PGFCELSIKSGESGYGCDRPVIRPRRPCVPVPLTSQTTGCGELLQILRAGVPRSRADLVAITGHARSTIGTRIDALLPTGLVRAEAASSTGGRPPSVYAFDPGARSVLAVDLGAVHLSVAVLDLAGTVLTEE